MEKNYSEKINKILEKEPDPAYGRRARIIFENLNIEGNEKVLEVGCGRGFYVKTLKTAWPGLDITGVDLNPNYLKIAREFIGDLKDNLKENLGVKLLLADATKLPFKDKTFDRIIASEILEHIEDDQKAISEMYRVLKPDGMVIVTVPNKNYPFYWDPANWILERVFNYHLPSNIWWISGIWADHVRLYDEGEIREKLGKEGFKIGKIWRATHYCLPFSHFLFYGIGKNLVEKGILPSMNRFRSDKKESLIKRIILWPVRKIDGRNETQLDRNNNCVNLIIRVSK